MDVLVAALILIVVTVFFVRSIPRDRSASSGLTSSRPHKKDLPSSDQSHDAQKEAVLKKKWMQHAQGQNDTWLRKAGYELDPEYYADQMLIQYRQSEAVPFKYRYQPPIILLAEPRATTNIETDGSSWLGGLPSLGSKTWPRARDGSPMHPVAQLDLSALAGVDTPEGLPKTGSLAFFLDLTEWPYSGAVTYISETDGRPTQPITELPRLAATVEDYDKEAGRYALKGYSRQNAPRMFPRWPIRFVPLEVDEETDRDDHQAAEEIWKLLPETKSTYYMIAEKYEDNYPTIMTPSKWHTAQKFANSVTRSREKIVQRVKCQRDTVDAPTDKQEERFAKEYQAIESLSPEGNESLHDLARRKNELLQKLMAKQARHKQLRDLEAKNMEFMIANHQAFCEFEEEVATWAFAQDQWSSMNARDLSQLQEYMAQVQKDLLDETPGFHLFMQGGSYMSEFINQTLEEMIRGPREIYEQIPRQIRDDFDRKALFRRFNDQHRMFGGYLTFHGLDRYEGDYILLSLGSDYLMGWEWGHGPAIFYISPQDLAEQRWDNVSVTVGYQ